MRTIKQRILYHLTFSILMIIIISFVKAIGIYGYSLNQKPSNFFQNIIEYDDYILIILILNILLFIWGDK